MRVVSLSKEKDQEQHFVADEDFVIQFSEKISGKQTTRNEKYILLKNDSKFILFNNAELLSKMNQSNEQMKSYPNSGYTIL